MYIYIQLKGNQDNDANRPSIKEYIKAYIDSLNEKKRNKGKETTGNNTRT